jgi:hypothetical protein
MFLTITLRIAYAATIVSPLFTPWPTRVIKTAQPLPISFRGVPMSSPATRPGYCVSPSMGEEWDCGRIDHHRDR